MRVFIDAQPLLGKRSGIGRYVECLAGQLNNRNDMQLVLAFNRIYKGINLEDFPPSTYTYANARYPYKVIRRLMNPSWIYELPCDLFSRRKADIFHGTNFTIIPTFKGKSIVNIHDLSFMRYPEATSSKIYNHHMKWVPYSARKADHIIAISNQTKIDLMEMLHIPEHKISVTYLAADDRFRPQTEKLDVLKKYNLPQQYILFIGTLEPRKNLLCLIHAFERLKRQHDVPHKLVIVGAAGWKYSPIFELVHSLDLASDIIFTGFVEDVDLPAIYSMAALFAFPSLYEGFGLPVLEAMQCGIPVLGSNVSSIPEIIADAGILIDPNDIDEWTKQMYAIVSDDSYHSALCNRSLRRSAQFSWLKTANETYSIYEQVLGKY